MTTFALICARGGSTRIPRKNLADLGGRPLLAWPIATAREAGIEDVYVSTEDDEIAEVAKMHGARVVQRPADLATATADMDAAIGHALHALAFVRGTERDDDVCVVLSACSPFVEPKSVRVAAGFGPSSPVASTVGVAEIDHHVAFEWDLATETPTWSRRPRTQDLPRRVYETGGLYGFRIGAFNGARSPTPTALVTLNRREALDIDTPEDLDRARMVLSLDAMGAWRSAVDDTTATLEAISAGMERGAMEDSPNTPSAYTAGYHDGLRAGRREGAFAAAAISHALRRKGAL